MSIRKFFGDKRRSTIVLRLLLIVLALVVVQALTGTSPAQAIDPLPGEQPAVIELAPDRQDTQSQASLLGGSQQAGSLLEERFGVALELRNTSGGANQWSFDWGSFLPGKNAKTVDWVEADWFGYWNTSSTSDYSTVRGAYPSGGEWYDVEAIYFDNDAVNFYVAIVTSVPHYLGGDDQNVGIHDPRISAGYWVRPGDLSIDLGLPNTARTERNQTIWHYNYGVDITHDDRSSLGGTAAMRDSQVGYKLYSTTSDGGGGNIDNPTIGDWYTSGPDHNVQAYWEHTNFDPFYPNPDLAPLGDTTVNYYEVAFPGGLLENNAKTYVVEVTIPRALFGDNNPGDGDLIGLRWTPGCRNDGNNDLAVIHLTGRVDDVESGDAPDSTNHAGLPMSLEPGGGPIGAHFPTVVDPATWGGEGAGMCHYRQPEGLMLGLGVSTEADADLVPDQDILTNLSPATDQPDQDSDDGLAFPDFWVDGTPTFVTYTVSVPAGAPHGERFVNIWMDWNRDGDWADGAVACLNGTRSEHVLADEMINVPGDVAPGGSITRHVWVNPCNPVPIDPAWVRITLSDEPVTGCSVRDEFNSDSFANNDGSTVWAGDWSEYDTAGAGPNAGNVDVHSGGLRLRDYPNSDTEPSASRSLDLSGADVAVLTFDFHTLTGVDTDDAIVLEARPAGASSWTTLETFTGFSGANSGSRSYNLAGHASANTTIRFRVSNKYGAFDEVFFIDNVQIRFTPCAGARDEFGAVSFGNNDGNLNWVADWSENDVAGPGPGTGNVFISEGWLWLDDEPDTGTEPSVARTMDLSGATTARLGFDFRTTSGVDSDDAVVLEVQRLGDTVWEVLETFTGFTGETTGSRSYDLSDFISAGTTIRFRVANKYGASSEFFGIDNVVFGLATVHHDGSGPDYCYAEGETEDYWFDPGIYDLGDLPDGAIGSYPTLVANNGARHRIILGGPVLGDIVDTESDGQPSTEALGDDNNPSIFNRDEDGVVRSDIVPGQDFTVGIKVSSVAANAFVDVWFDFDNDGILANTPVEHFRIPVTSSTGSFTYDFPAPLDAHLGFVYARFRISTAGTDNPYGTAPDGEVEDWRFSSNPPLAVFMGAIKATAFVDAVLVEWEGFNEFNTIGYNVERAQSPDGPWTKLNGSMIQSKTDSLDGASYDFADLDVEQGIKDYYYRIVSLDNSAKPTYSEVIKVTVPIIGEPYEPYAPPTPASIHLVFLPMVGK